MFTFSQYHSVAWVQHKPAPTHKPTVTRCKHPIHNWTPLWFQLDHVSCALLFFEQDSLSLHHILHILQNGSSQRTHYSKPWTDHSLSSLGIHAEVWKTENHLSLCLSTINMCSRGFWCNSIKYKHVQTIIYPKGRIRAHFECRQIHS